MFDLTILEKNNTIPNIFNGPYKLVHSIEHNGNFLGSFWVRVTVEPTIVFAENLNKLTMARAIDEVIEFLYDKVPEQLGISDSFIVFENSFNYNYIKFLKRHFKVDEMSKVLRMVRNDAK